MRIARTKRIWRIAVSAIAVLMLAAILLSINPGTTMTGNAASLKHIDEIVAAHGTFNILEIVPDKSAASFGYYVDGQEPVSSADFSAYSDGTKQYSGWTAALSQLTSPAARTSFVNTLFGRLASKGVLGNGAAAPLKYTYLDGANYYTETYLADDPQNWNRLPLKTAESIQMTGTFTPEPNGAFRAEYAYSPAAGGETGQYVQNISSFDYTPADPGTGSAYYYSPAFTLITPGMDLTDTPTMKWSTTAVYTELKDASGNNVKDANGRDIYVTGQHKTVKEILDNGGFNADENVHYYYVAPTQTGAPSTYSSTSCYAAVVNTDDSDDAPGDGFTAPPVTGDPAAPGTAYFTRSISSYTYVGTGGNYSRTSTTGGTQTVNFKAVYYKGGFTNNNLFKQYVLGLADPGNNPTHAPDYSALNVTVTVKKASEVTGADITAAGMIYISAGTDIANSNAKTGYDADDIQDAPAVQLYNYEAENNPVIIDYSIVKGITSDTQSSQIKRIQKLCLLCLQPENTKTTQTSLNGLTVDWNKLTYISNDDDKTFVNNNIYCFSPFNTVSTANHPNIINPGPNDIITVVTKLFNQPFSQEVYSSNFTSVLDEIQKENFLKQIAGQTDLLPENVTVSAAVRHIINYKGQRVTTPKTSIRVLDLEPAKVTSASPSYLTPDTVNGWINNQLLPNNITIVHMTTGEFVGKIEDINETYDMIYIGMSTESLNTLNGSTVYNDEDMNGLIYTGIGDIFTASMELAGIRSQDYVTADGKLAINGSTGSTANQFRFSGNDITKTKVTELQKFARAGYPIILADGFISGSGVSTNTVDNSSYMYEAVSSVYGAYANVMTQSFAENVTNKDTVVKYLNVSKPSITITSKPVEYADDTNASITADPNDGYYYLNYVFSISNITDPSPVSTTYDCGLYIDLNADGRYADSERLDDIEVHRVSDGALILPAKVSGSEKEYYTLSADIQYQISRQMPQEYAGIIPWKLEVVKNNADQIHASAQGYSRMAAVTKKTINVLQIMQPGTLDTKLNLAKQTTEKNTDGTYKGIYGRLINSLRDFDVNISVVTTDVLETKGQTSDDILSWINSKSVTNKKGELVGADMLIIGFNDCYDGIQAKSAAAIVSYINSKKSVLFTHDTTSLTQVPSGTQLAVGQTPLTLDATDILYNTSAHIYQNVKSSNPEVYWYDTSSGIANPPAITAGAYPYVVFITAMPTGTAESDYFDKKASATNGNFQIYKVNSNGTYTQVTGVSASTSLSTFKTKNNITTPILYVLCSAASGSFTDPRGDLTKSNQNITATYNITKFVGSSRYNLNNYAYHYDYGRNGDSTVYKTSYTAHLMCLYKSTVTSYTYSGTYDSGANTYSINSKTWYPATGAPFPQSTLYATNPLEPQQYTTSAFPNNITDWGYYFNTIIRDAVGLDRYGVKSSEKADTNGDGIGDGPPIGSFVNVLAPMSSTSIDTVLDNNRSVAFAPKSGRELTVNEYQGYTNYALIRFAGSNACEYTNNTYSNRETTNVSQVNKGQITTYPYNVNTEDFGGNDSTITGYGGSYMKIGLTHEQYFQINMNTDDIVVWYCLSNGGTDGSSYYDDVPNDCVNAYYIYNKGNVTYSGVGHSSNASLYTGTSIGQEYVNEAKLFVNTMIAAYQSTAQPPYIKIKKDARGTSDLNDMYILTDDTSVLSNALSPTDESRAVYFRLSDPNVGVDKTITVQYYVADSNGTMVDGIKEKVLPLTADDNAGMPLTTYNSNGVPVAMAENNQDVMETKLKGGYVYKLYLPYARCLEKLNDNSVYSVRVYVKVTTMIGQTPLTPAVDSIEVKKQQLFQLS